MKNDLKLKNLKGTVDFLPSQQAARDFIVETLKKSFVKYGYLPVESAILCPFDLLSSKYAGGAEILKEVYRLKDQGDRDLGLRYDLTVPFAKLIAANHNLPLPFRRFEIGKVFRDGPVKLGRNREFTQCDIDVCGIPGRLVEAEFFQMTEECFSNLGLDVEIVWNNRKYLAGILEECNVKEISKTILCLDKLEKIGKQEVALELEKEGLSTGEIKRIFELLSKDPNEVFETAKSQTLKDGCEEILELGELISKLGLKTCKFSSTLARGLEIYTGTIWEVFDKTKKISSSLCGGGRYDEIIGKFIDDGKQYPALGMTFGLEPISILVGEKFKEESLLDLSIFAFDKNYYVLEIAKKFREANIKTVVDFSSSRLKKFLESSSNQKIPFVAIIGEDEIKENKVMLRDMKNSTQSALSIEEAIEVIKKGRK